MLKKSARGIKGWSLLGGKVVVFMVYPGNFYAGRRTAWVSPQPHGWWVGVGPPSWWFGRYSNYRPPPLPVFPEVPIFRSTFSFSAERILPRVVPWWVSPYAFP